MATARAGAARRVPAAVRVAGVVSLVLVLAAAAGLAGFVVWNREYRRAGPANAGEDCPLVVPVRHSPPLATFGTERVALIGDSIMAQASCSVADALADLGIETSRHAVPGSGLLNGPVDWIATIDEIMRVRRPDVVVAIFVGNYLAPPVRDARGREIGMDTPEFFAAWQRRAEALSAIVRRYGARMYWVSPPPIELPPLAHAARLFEGYRTIRGDHVLESGRALASRTGELVSERETCGRRRLVRSPLDGVHLAPDGARIYGQQIAHDLTARLGIVVAPKPC
jgi:hypothetical protein